MKAKMIEIALSVLLIGITGTAVLAEEKFGVQIYPGAVFDSKTTEAFSGSSGEMAFYTTKDDIAEVFEFYSNQPGIKPMGTGLMPTDDGRSGAAFSGDNIMISIERPYLDMSAATFDEETGVTGKMIDNTLISIQKY
jgi:hypothetical protein